MSELSLILAPSPELLATAAGLPTSPATGAPGNAGSPFADLLTGMLAGTQPLATAADPLPVDVIAALIADDLPDTATATATDTDTDTDADPQVLLALPGEFASPGATGQSLPVAGKPLPPEPSLGAAPVAELVNPPEDQAAARQEAAPGETRPRISLTDLALSRQLAPAPEPTATIGRAGSEGDGFALPDQRTTAPASAALAFTRKYLTQRSEPPSVAPTVAAEPVVLAGSTEFAAGLLAALTASTTSNTGLPAPALPAVAAVAGRANVPLVVRQDGGAPPALLPLGDAGAFAGGLADRLLALGGTGVQTARLMLHPEHLGALTIEIQIEDGAAQVWFGTATSQAHSAIEGSLPRLRELFAEQGIALTRTQVDVGAGQPGNSGFDQQRRMAGDARPDVDRPWRPATPGRPAAVPGLPLNLGAASRRLDVWA